MVDKRNTEDWVARDERPGRRTSDRNQCAMHDYLTNKNDHCFDLIKESIREEVQRSDHKFEVLENRLEQYISKWSLGIIISISATVFSALVGFGILQMKTMHEELSGISNQVAALSSSIIELRVSQMQLYSNYEKLTPEHKRLMEHMYQSAKENELFKTNKEMPK